MSEEEKKAIKRLANTTAEDIINANCNPIDIENYIGIVLILLEKQQKEIEEKDKQIDRLSLIRQETRYGYDNTYLITEDRLVTLERNTYKIEVEEGKFVDVKELYDLYKDSIPKEAIREKRNEEIGKTMHIVYSRQNGRSFEQGIRIGRIKTYEELLGE